MKRGRRFTLWQVCRAPVCIAALSLFGIAFETIGDAQLVRFKRDPANQEQVMTSGLWRYTRHPNYFGDACAWWGMYLVAAETGPGRPTARRRSPRA